MPWLTTRNWHWWTVKNGTLRQRRYLKCLPLRTFHLYVVTFQQHPHIEYISSSWYNIPETVFLSWYLRLLLTRKPLNNGFLMLNLKSSPRKLYSRHHDMVNRYGISVSQMTTDMFRLSESKSSLFSFITGFVTQGTGRVPLVEQEILIRPEHMGSSRF
jgi:hypothetical protein